MISYNNMKISLIRYSIIAFTWLAVLYPLWVRMENINWTFNSASLPFALFPFFGLAAFALLWLHAISGVFEPQLRTYFDFDRYVHITSMLILLCLIAHPLLLIIGMGAEFTKLFSGGKYIWLAIIGWLLLITYDIGKALQRYDFFVRNWQNILTISTIGFLLTFFHSIGIGNDVASGPLRIIWIFYGVTAIFATIYTYGIKRFWNIKRN